MIDGITITPDLITGEEEAALLALADSGAWKPHALGGRQQMFHGPEVGGRGVPDAFIPLARRVYGDPYRLLIRDYAPGEGMAAHRDVAEGWRIHGGIVSLLSPADWVFTRGAMRVRVHVPARSLFTLAGPARYDWHHEVRPVKDRRVSLYFSFKEIQ